VKWTASKDYTGTYGLTKIQCHEVDYGPGTPFGLSNVRSFLRIMRDILEL